VLKKAKKPLAKKQIQKTNQGVDTANRMKKKISEMKASKKKDEDIESNEDSYEDEAEKKPKTAGAISADMIRGDAFFQGDEDENESPDEKRLRMTKALIKELGEETKEKENFFHGLQANTSTDVNIISAEDDEVRKVLKYKILEQKEKLFYNIADEYGSTEAEFDRVFIKGHKKAITAMEWMPDNKQIITASKDCNLIMWDLESQKK
jgi:ribosomal RNA-processing protein 9